MNFLNQFLSFMLSPNSIFISIIGILFSFLEATITMLLFTTILNLCSNKSQKILYVFVFSFIAIFSKIFLPSPYNIIINIIACPVLVILIFKTTLLKSILSEIIPFVIFALAGSLLIKIYTSSIKISSELVNSIPIYKLIFSISLYFTIYIIYRILKHYKLNINLIKNFKFKNNLILLVSLIIGIVSIAIESYILFAYNNSIPIVLNLSSLFVLLIYFLFNIYSLIRTSELELANQNLEEAKLYNKTLNILYDNIICFKHDFNNIVQSIGGYIYTDDLSGLKHYYTELVDDCQKVNNLSILNPETINNPAIYSLLTSKYHQAYEMGIKINMEIFIDLNTINFKIYELTKILGILLDNAIEASSKCKKKIINIIMRQDLKCSKQLIIIENSYNNKDVDINKIFDKSYTDKNLGSHGLGLWKISQILKRNNNLNLLTTKDNKVFKQQLEFYL